ncbi:MAG: ISAs1 family transposase [Shewanella fodinae]|jgi:predicted transposase YbfD/YdcC|nr:ISAs1 family transposase [Shewanella fodinae]MCD8476220.1 ISAs1 family transposase [Shewanella fodinae]MCL2908392.1 ISAs1 family transposase [Shewanella fodinae]GGZ15956.1 ISAs1 family transposase [Shewanella fodinae]
MDLLEHLTVVEETRSDINQRHNLVDVMFLVLSAIMSGAEGWQDIETFGDSKLPWLQKFRPFNHGIPRRHTIARILRTVVVESLLEALLNWVNEQRTYTGKPIIAFDGKVLRGAYRNDSKTALQLVTAYDTENGLVLSQQPTKNKKGEISVVRQMLDVLNLNGAVITLDALHCQRETLEKISEKKAHVVVQVKKNQPTLWNAVQSQFQAVFDAKKEQVVTEVRQEAHGRKEERYVFQLKAKLPENLVEKWPTIRSIIAVERHRTEGRKTTIDTRYYVSSLSPRHKLLGHYIRQHWRIENSQHYVLDVVFKEDESRIALEGAVENLALFRRFVMNILRQCDCGSPSQRNKLKQASWSDDYREKVFFG